MAELCNRTSEPAPYQILVTCLQRNYGLGDTHIHQELKSGSIKFRSFITKTSQGVRNGKNEYTMRVDKREVISKELVMVLTFCTAGGCDMQEQKGWKAAGRCQTPAAAAPAHQQLGQLAQDVWQQVGCSFLNINSDHVFLQVNQNLEKEEGKGDRGHRWG